MTAKQDGWDAVDDKLKHALSGKEAIFELLEKVAVSRKTSIKSIYWPDGTFQELVEAGATKPHDIQLDNLDEILIETKDGKRFFVILPRLYTWKEAHGRS